jgi:hypothetical protein
VAATLDAPDTLPTTLLNLAPSPNGVTGLTWSPDGAYLLYLSDADSVSVAADGSSGPCWTPRLVPATGGAVINLQGVCYLTRTTLPQWSADSRYLLLTTDGGLAVIDVPAALADPAHVQPIYLTDLPPGQAHSPIWQP